MSALDPFAEVDVLGEWRVILPDYRVSHYAQHSTWEEGRLRSMHAHLKPGMVLYDVGAEHGDLSALYGTWVKGPLPSAAVMAGVLEYPDQGGVVLVEGSEKFWPVMRATFAANNLTPLGCWAGFASDVDSDESERTPSWATPSFADGKTWPSWADGDPEPHFGFKSLVESKRTIPNITFDTLSTMCAPPDALTIDTEGSEARVLRGSARILGELRPLVWTSVHEALLWFDYPEWPGMTTEEVLPWFHTFMADFGYRSQFLERNHETHVVSWPEEREDFDPFLGVEYLRDA